MSQVQTIVVRQGLSADVPALVAGELGYDTDTKTFRVGDDTPIPAKLVSDKTTETFDLSQANITFGSIELAEGATVDGLNMSTMNLNEGLVSRTSTPGVFVNTRFISSDESLDIGNPTGSGGAIDLKLNSDVLETLTNNTYLQEVAHDGTLSGKGDFDSPLTVTNASTNQGGAIRIATQTQVNSGTSTTLAVTPGYLSQVSADSTLGSALAALVSSSVSIESSNAFTGAGNATSPLEIETATESLRAGLQVATESQMETATSDARAVTPLKLASIDPNTNMAIALRKTVMPGGNWEYLNVPTTGLSQSLPAQTTDIIIQVTAEVDSSAGVNYDSFVEFYTEVLIEMYVDGTWRQVAKPFRAYATYGPISSPADRPSNDKGKSATIYVGVDQDNTPNRLIHLDGVESGVWDQRIRARTNLVGSGTIGGNPASNTGSSEVTVIYR